MTESLRFGQVSFASPDRLFRNLAFRDIQYRADDFFFACLVPNAMCKIMKILYRTIRHHQPMLPIKVIYALNRTMKNIFKKA
ncbi:MAG TPA: hypothetical protein VE222_00355, partial [Nitrospiraceae bacterium]|nr:hypothetical protein [Nitrospiraceae bacterium]